MILPLLLLFSLALAEEALLLQINGSEKSEGQEIKKIICENENDSLTCSSGVIKILSANYGRTDATTCPHPAMQTTSCFSDQLNFIKSKCEDKESCTIRSDNTMGDPCPGTYKYLEVRFYCQPPPAQEIKKIICENENDALTCSSGVIKILKANYGRTDATTCPHPAMQTTSCFSDQLNFIKSKCEDKKSCAIRSDNTMGDACPGTYKYLDVRFYCQQAPAMTKLLVALGNGKSVEVVNLDENNPNMVCDDLPDFPEALQGSTGQLFQGSKPIICIGYNGNNLCACHTLTDGNWVSMAGVSRCRRYGASVTLSPGGQDILLVAGGYLYTGVVEAFDGLAWKTAPSMPYAVTEFCLVRINDTLAMAVGGHVGSETKLTSFYDISKNSWTLGPSLPVGRRGLASGVLNWNNPATGQFEKVVVVYGGTTPTGLLSTSLLLYINRINDGWQPGPDLGKLHSRASIVEYKGSLILSGGEGDVDGLHLYKLDSPQGPWVEMKQTLKMKRANHVSFLIPDELVKCH